MKDSGLRLQDKTIFLVGPFNGITQAIVRTMTEFGADVGYFSDHQFAAKYVGGVNEAREVHAEYGRAVHYALPLHSEKQIQEALGRVTESLGRMDILIDASPLAWNAGTDLAAASAGCALLADKLIPFFLAKQRGRVIYLFEDACLDRLRSDVPAEAQRESVLGLVKNLGTQYRGQSVTANALAIGITEDFLLRLMPKSPSLKRSLEGLQKENPGLKLVEFNDVSLGVAFLAGALSASLTGQVLRLTHGFHL